MTLAFSQELNGNKTYFINKIWKSLVDNDISPLHSYQKYLYLYDNKFGDVWDFGVGLPAKIHTIREDKANRWKEGNMIHFVINNRTKDRFQFAPVVFCTGVQKIEIKYNDYPVVIIDNRPLYISNKEDYSILHKLAQNDGFETIEEFFGYFNKDFKGKIIHWTNFEY